jgi:hypothetical protein
MPLVKEPKLIYYDWQHFRPELVGERSGDRFRTLPFVTMGGGQRQADPFLAHAHRALFGDAHFPTTKDARLLVAWTLDHVMRFNTGGIGGDTMDIAVLEKTNDQWRAKMCDPGEAQQAVEDILRHVRDYPKLLLENSAPDLAQALGKPESGK